MNDFVKPCTESVDFDRPPADPLTLFSQWLDDAQRHEPRPNVNAMTLATVDPDGRPSARIVLLRGFDRDGAVFYTNRMSRKGKALAAHPIAALVFHWDTLDRQVRIEGRVTTVADALSDAYFASRSRERQLGAWASAQSAPLNSRAELDDAVTAMRASFEGIDIPRPPHWGGYRVALDRIEFWQGSPHRVHDRMIYTPDNDHGWNTQRISP